MVRGKLEQVVYALVAGSGLSLTRALNGAFLIAIAFSPIGAIGAASHMIRGVELCTGCSYQAKHHEKRRERVMDVKSLFGVSTRLSFLSFGLGGHLLAVAENSPLLVGGIAVRGCNILQAAS